MTDVRDADSGSTRDSFNEVDNEDSVDRNTESRGHSLSLADAHQTLDDVITRDTSDVKTRVDTMGNQTGADDDSDEDTELKHDVDNTGTGEEGEYEYKGCIMPQVCPRNAIENCKVLDTHSDDVCIASYPRAESTWMAEILSLLYSDDLDTTRQVPLAIRVPLIEWYSILAAGGGGVGDAVELFMSRKSPRLFNTHLPSGIFQNQIANYNMKAVVVVRNLKDTLVSYYHFSKSLKEFPFKGDWDDFFRNFQRKRLRHGDWSESVISWLQLRHLPNVLVVRYEDMERDLVPEIKRIAEYCGQHLSPERYKKIGGLASLAHGHPTEPDLSGDGRPVTWRRLFTVAQSEFVDEIYRKEVQSVDPNLAKFYLELNDW